MLTRPARSNAVASGLPADTLVAQIDENQVVVGSVGDQFEAVFLEPVGQRAGIADASGGIAGEFGPQGFLQRDGDGCRDGVVRSTLQAGEDRLVDLVRVFGATEDHGAARAAQ